MNLRENIVSQFSLLSPELQRAAEFSLQNANQLVVQSMRAFAAEAGVKPATLLRLAQRLGYNGWRELKSAFIDDLGLGNDTYVSKAEKLIAKGTQPALYEEVFLAHQANLAFTQAENQHAMQQAVTLLDEAKQVYICGFRASFPIAWSLFYVYRLFNRQVSLIDGLASNIEVFTREINAEDCLLLTSFSPYSRESLDVLNAARQARARIIAITDSPVSPLAQAADCTLLFSLSSPSFFPSIVSGMGVAECLLAMLVARHGREAVNKIESAERYLQRSGAYVMPDKS
ncbi:MULTISPECIES: MurR/RpiR family transcriptional regulator [Klebsiella]|uniref:RpiR family transcriptional regulator n=1 Tax=Klebsiella michiganensis (strain ATCC 8724 / DSM 4798 / JCM 20051 / NBRC 3318 / NRRL B-199 / KCTC 1686 / BUCSAV 143 / CCM 1901) TaxID=1006551 RepID=A0A0H3H984_KLEM8|nr:MULTISPECIES: MurR/RpiR family transcriptional regulator [Klebsiella]AEX05837.1 RpiR family transcriptional regulator [Klebsiella michiganensis KCTC 1686]AHW88861.1 RpiR family transcriptional regulator [Klebsiella michiganensis HKOPL1]MBG2547747.1 MurR/RpiR family transcriptional regulator [Klebsiella michiganensis]MBZ7185967.1 MurR/RpiR family transcriptional regulator [Klebsiella michiganensis]MBZ7231714.1 MurR/RpiR family transcriptional regulator [Klebsiella michiganensis]